MTVPAPSVRLKPCPFCGATPHRGKTKAMREQLHGDVYQDFSFWCPKGHARVTDINQDRAREAWNTRATLSQPADARERIGEILRQHGVFASNQEQHIRNSLECADAIIAAGFVRDEAAIFICHDGCGDYFVSRDRPAHPVAIFYDEDAVDDVVAFLNREPDKVAEAPLHSEWHTTGWDRARNSGRILLVWREFAGVREHVELGRYSDPKSAWVNTYGHPFHGDPDGWAPLLPFKTESTIRADERERCARVAERIAEDHQDGCDACLSEGPPNTRGALTQARQMQAAADIAAAIRRGE